VHVTMKDIARDAGISQPAVLYARNGKPGVDGATRERIYRPISIEWFEECEVCSEVIHGHHGIPPQSGPDVSGPVLECDDFFGEIELEGEPSIDRWAGKVKSPIRRQRLI